MAATLIGFTGFVVRAQSPEPLPLIPLWDSIYTLRSGAGYKDNVFLSHARPQGSAFISGSAEVLAMRVAPTGPQYSFFASAEANHFLSTTPAHDEFAAFARAQLERDINPSIKGSLAAQYFYQDQVLDVSVSETNREAVPVRGHTIAVVAGVTLDLPNEFWLALEPAATRQFFGGILDDYWEAGPKLTLGRNYDGKSYVSLSYEPLWRFYETDEARTAAGLSVTNSERRRFEQQVRLTWRHHWDEAKRWRSTLNLAGRLTEENGGGFSDYTSYSASAQLQYRTSQWELSARGRVGRFDYTTQTVSASDLSKRARTEWVVEVRLERKLTEHFKLAAGYEHEVALSNDALETYTVNTVSGSLQWEF